ncbi:MAG TPA: class I adenylate-forming enzyme family protein [Syntrophales bacterium]|nr:class I adenylate-forming enzyme family protein [Syntrophales bacterium]HOL59664.1 class I adenylate-forming enzyme family protein [Syntrophales bacterium]HPO35810.1 class I adenylate-forming enzyme family protein [Syntrophales bacterium]
MAIESNVTPEQIAYYTKLGFWDKWTFIDYIKRWAEAFPEKEALIDQDKRLTWSQYRQMVDRIALNFLALGIKRDDLVIAQIPNCVEAVIIEMALARIGACVVPIAMQWREHELDYVIGLTEATGAIVQAEYYGFNYPEMMSNLRQKHASLKHIIVLGKDVPAGCVPFGAMWEQALEREFAPDYLDKNCPINANDVLTLCFTSGTEADPKGCPRTHNHWKSFERSGFLHHLTLNVHDRVVMALPWINLFGQSVGILPMTMVGGTLILLDGFQPATMAQTIAKEKATVYAGVPSMHVALLQYPELEKYDLSSLRVVVTGGAPCPTAVIEQMMGKFGCLVWNGFGSNEGHLNVTELGLSPELVSTTIGIPQLYSQTKIVDEKGNELGVGQIGEFCQKAPFIIAGYYKRPDLNRERWDKDGFYHSGDACYLDENGFYHFVTRLKDIIIRGGMNISAEEVEFILYKHPQVMHAAVVGMPDERFGERVCAFIELKPGASEISLKEVRAFMEKEKVAEYKWPEKVIVIDKLPRTPTGKVLKYVLREMAAKKKTS